MNVYTWKEDIDKTNEIYMWTFHKLAKEKYSIVNVKLNASLIAGSSFYHIKEYNQYQRNVYVSIVISKIDWTIKCRFHENVHII